MRRGVAGSPAPREAGPAARGKKRRRWRELAERWTDRVPAGTASPALAPASPLSPCWAGRGRKDLAEGGPRGSRHSPGMACIRAAGPRSDPVRPPPGQARLRLPGRAPRPLRPGNGGGSPLAPWPWFPPSGDPVLLVAPPLGGGYPPSRAAPFPQWVPSPRRPPPGGPLPRTAPHPSYPGPRLSRSTPQPPLSGGGRAAGPGPLISSARAFHFAFPDTAGKEAQRPGLSEAF